MNTTAHMAPKATTPGKTYFTSIVLISCDTMTWQEAILTGRTQISLVQNLVMYVAVLTVSSSVAVQYSLRYGEWWRKQGVIEPVYSCMEL